VTVEIRPLEPDDDRDQFRSGDAALNLFFARYAGQNQFRHHIGVTYVAMEGERAVGFVTVSPATIEAEDLPPGRRRPRYPLPVLRVARLAVDERATGRGLGGALLRFCIELAERLRDEVGCVGLVVDAKPQAVTFYKRFGFVTIELLEGSMLQRPAPQPMFLALDAVPQRC
jgi:GNAT superfamily N-acetyltransferase